MNDVKCQCGSLEHSRCCGRGVCNKPMTQEDGLCDWCRKWHPIMADRQAAAS